MLEVLEALYKLDLPQQAWAAGVAKSLSSLMDRDHLGVLGVPYQCSDPCSFSAETPIALGVPDSLVEVFVTGQRHLSPEYVAEKYLGRFYGLSANMRGWHKIPPVADGTLSALGAVDMLSLNATEIDGVGWAFQSFQARRAPVSDHVHLAMTRIGTHLAAASRLRRRLRLHLSPLNDAAAIFDREGRIVHASGDARKKAYRETLKLNAEDMLRARERRGRKSAPPAAEDWQALIARRWTVIDYVERDGKQYLVAVENSETPAGVGLLSKREHNVLRCAMRGLHPKAIAYELGIAYSTVRVLMSRIVAKMGVHSWQEAIQIRQGNSQDLQV